MNPENYRPIALLNTIVKIFTQIIYIRTKKWCHVNNLLPEFQSGFRSNRSCLDNIFTLNSLVQLKLKRKAGKLFAVFVDFKRAFPSVDHGLLWRKLYEYGLSVKILKILISLYDKAKMCVKSREGISNAIEITEGLMQGDTISPILFALLIRDLETFLRDRGSRGVEINNLINILLLAFADDIVIVA